MPEGLEKRGSRQIVTAREAEEWRWHCARLQVALWLIEAETARPVARLGVREGSQWLA